MGGIRLEVRTPHDDQAARGRLQAALNDMVKPGDVVGWRLIPDLDGHQHIHVYHCADRHGVAVYCDLVIHRACAPGVPEIGVRALVEQMNLVVVSEQRQLTHQIIIAYFNAWSPEHGCCRAPRWVR